MKYMKAGDIVGSVLDPMHLFYKPSGTKGAKGVEGASGSKDNVSQHLGPVTQLLAAVPGPLNTILGGVLGGK